MDRQPGCKESNANASKPCRCDAPPFHRMSPPKPQTATRRRASSIHLARRLGRLALPALALAPGWARASLFQGETLDSVAMGLAWFIVVAMPILGIVIFWKLHVLPEKIAEKRHHPQKDAIHVLCLLSLVFGGLLWPLAWLWAYTRPTATFIARGTEKHDDYFREMGEKWHAGELKPDEVDELRDELDAIAARGRLPRKLRQLQHDLDAAHEADLAAGHGAHGAA